MNERDLRRLLLAQPVPGEQLAEERTWHAVRTAYAEREPVPRPRNMRWKLLLAAAVAAALVAVGVSPVGSEIGGWIRDTVGRERVVGVAPAKPELVSLPSSGRLLVAAESGVWVVGRDGSRRRLGGYAGGTWSPNGLFVAVWKGRQLAALDPARTDAVHWSLSRKRIADARWSPSGFRVAYRSGRSLRVVAGNGADDGLVAERVAPVAPAWKGVREHVLAYAAPDGRAVVLDTDTRTRLWRTTPVRDPVALAWTERGELAALGRDELRVFDGEGKQLHRLRLGTGAEGVALAARPGADAVAFTAYSDSGGVGTVWLYDTDSGRARLVFSGAGRFRDVTFSPDGRLVLVGWAAADQWLFVPVRADARVLALASVAADFDPDVSGIATFPRIEGWCCPDSFR
jgi:hypothetical protein